MSSQEVVFNQHFWAEYTNCPTFRLAWFNPKATCLEQGPDYYYWGWGSDIIIACCLRWGSDSIIAGGQVQLGVGIRQHYRSGSGSDSIIAGGRVQTPLLLGVGIRHHYSLQLRVGFRQHYSLGLGSAWSGDQTALQMGVGLRQHYCWGQGSESIIAGGGDQTALQLVARFRQHYCQGQGSESIIAGSWDQTALQLVAGFRQHYYWLLGFRKLGVGLRLHQRGGRDGKFSLL